MLLSLQRFALVFLGSLALVLLARLAVWELTEAWWFESVGARAVFDVTLRAKATLAAVAALMALILVGFNARLALGGARAQVPSGEIFGISPMRASDAVTALVALSAASAASGSWAELILFRSGGSFGYIDPIFGLDAGFYVFRLALLRSAVRLAALLMSVALLSSGAMYVAVGTVRVKLVQQDGQLVPAGLIFPPRARSHLAAQGALLLALLAGSSLLSRYVAMYEPSGLLTGPGYAERYATIPLLLAEAVVALFAAAAMLLAARRASLRWMLAAAVALVASRGATIVLPRLVHRLHVAPNEMLRETPQIESHLAATREAWGLDLSRRELPQGGPLDASDIDPLRPVLGEVRLWDNLPLLDTVAQIEEPRPCCHVRTIDAVRYREDHRLRHVLSAPREPVLARTPSGEIPKGDGLWLGLAGSASDRGLPVALGSQPAEGLGTEGLALYFSEAAAGPVVVTPHPDGGLPHYSGRDGVEIGRFGRWLFAARLGSTEVLLSDLVRADSRALMYREIRERAEHITPFFAYDSDPYLVVADGRPVWMLDAMTRSASFPYSARVEPLGNYARRAAVVTVDAYDGTIALYRTETPCPLADAWSQAFPGLLRPMSEMPGALREQLRYPADLFSAQAKLFATYRVETARRFYQREGQLSIPVIEGDPLAPEFAVVRLPGEERDAFVLMLPLSPTGEPDLAGWLVAHTDLSGPDALVWYEIPSGSAIEGPARVAARIRQDEAVREKLFSWNQQGSSAEFGALRAVPVGGSALYIQPLYLRATRGSVPELSRILVSSGDRVAMGTTLPRALDQLFGSQPPAAPAEGHPQPLPSPSLPAELVRKALSHWESAQGAMKKGDWVQYGLHIQMLGDVIGEMNALIE